MENLNQKALATSGDHQPVRIRIDIEDIDTCVLQMAQSALVFDSELAMCCDEARVSKLI